MNKVLLILLLVTIAWASIQNDQGWENYKQKYYRNKLFGSQEKEMKAYLNFKTNEQKVKMHNANPERTYNQGLNKLSIYNEVEVAKRYCGTRPPPDMKDFQPRAEIKTCTGPRGTFDSSNLPATLDCRKSYPPVQDQGGCGSCWAFATAAGIENYIMNRQPTFSRVISQSFFVDCDTAKNEGCNGGWHNEAALFAKNFADNQAPDNVDYPYKYPTDGSNRFTCKNVTSNLIKLDIMNPLFPGKLSVKEMKLLLNCHGHIVVAIYASDQFMRYANGTYGGDGCKNLRPKEANHAVVAVGYGEDYFIVRNSWSAGWGDKGYINMKITKKGKTTEGVCNIQQYPLVIQ